MGKPGAESGYEDLRKTRIKENQAILASLGLEKTISDLRSIASPKKPRRKYQRRGVCAVSELRRSDRLKLANAGSETDNTLLLRSDRVGGRFGNVGLYTEILEEDIDFDEDEGQRPANAPLVKIKGSYPGLSPEASARRCNSKGRGSVYDPVFGICCHFCRQKKLCGEEDCKHCGDLDMDEPCIGKTDCSVCHSSRGVFCRACLKVRYGEELEEVRENKDWMCPHCIEEKGLKPYWICNSSLCLKKQKLAPTGIAIFRAREQGYESVAHLLMDKLRGQG